MTLFKINSMNKKWFSACGFWATKIESGIHYGRCFVTSDPDFDGDNRKYTLRIAFEHEENRIDNIGEFRQYETLADALKALYDIKESELPLN